MARYAENTEVPSDRSRAEIETTVRRYGAVRFGYGWDGDRAFVAFEIADPPRQIRLLLPLPDRNNRQFTHTPGRGLLRDAAGRDTEYEKAVRQRWRALALVVKAKLEAVEAGISTVENEFAAFIVLPDGRTVGDWLTPQLERAYTSGVMPPPMLAIAGAA